MYLDILSTVILLLILGLMFLLIGFRIVFFKKDITYTYGSRLFLRLLFPLYNLVTFIFREREDFLTERLTGKKKNLLGFISMITGCIILYASRQVWDYYLILLNK